MGGGGSAYPGPDGRRDRYLGGDCRVGHVRAPKESRRPCQGHRGARPCHWAGPSGGRAGHSKPPIHGGHREGDPAPAPSRAASDAAAVPGGRVRRRLRHPGRHARLRQHLVHRPRPRGVGGSHGVPPGALRRREQRRRRGPERAALRAAAVRLRPPDVPRHGPRPQDGADDLGQPAARLRVEAPRRRGGRGAEHGGDVRDHRAAPGPARGHR